MLSPTGARSRSRETGISTTNGRAGLRSNIATEDRDIPRISTGARLTRSKPAFWAAFNVNSRKALRSGIEAKLVLLLSIFPVQERQYISLLPSAGNSRLFRATRYSCLTRQACLVPAAGSCRNSRPCSGDARSSGRSCPARVHKPPP